MKKILFCASTSQHLRRFHLPYLRAFRQAGWQVWAASGSEDPVAEADRFVRLPLEKRLLSGKNAQAVLAARRLLMQEQFDCVSVHTTLAAAAVRLAARAMKQRSKIFYTCHGYLFSESDGARSAPYLLAEKLCAPVTDVLMVMNREDREIARRHSLCGAGEPRLIPGMGVDLRRYAPWDERRRLQSRGAHGYTPQDFVLVYAAEFSPRKNHELLLRAFAAAVPDCPGLRLFLAGEGALRGNCERLAAELGISGVRPVRRFRHHKPERGAALQCDGGHGCEAAGGCDAREGPRGPHPKRGDGPAVRSPFRHRCGGRHPTALPCAGALRGAGGNGAP